MPIKLHSGFSNPVTVPKKLAKFLKLNKGVKLSKPELTKKIWKTIKDKDLVYANDSRVFRTNTEVSDIFGVDEKANDSISHKDKYGFNFCNLQSHISYALNEKDDESDNEDNEIEDEDKYKYNYSEIEKHFDNGMKKIISDNEFDKNINEIKTNVTQFKNTINELGNDLTNIKNYYCTEKNYKPNQQSELNKNAKVSTHEQPIQITIDSDKATDADIVDSIIEQLMNNTMNDEEKELFQLQLDHIDATATDAQSDHSLAQLTEDVNNGCDAIKKKFYETKKQNELDKNVNIEKILNVQSLKVKNNYDTMEININLDDLIQIDGKH